MVGAGRGDAGQHGAVDRLDVPLVAGRRVRVDAILAAIPGAAVTLFDQQLRIRYFDGSLPRDAGFDPRDALGCTVGDLLVPAAEAERVEGHLRAALGGETRVYDQVAAGKTLEVRAVPFREEPGRPVTGVLTITQDATARRLLEAAHADAEQRFRVAFHSAAAGACLTAPEGHLIEANPALADMLGTSVEQLIGLSIADITYPDDLNESLAWVRAALAGEQDEARFEKRFRHADGHAIPGLLTSALVRDAGGRPLYFTSQIIDLTDSVRAAAQLARVEQRSRLMLRNLPGTVLALYDRDLHVIETDGVSDSDTPHTEESVRGAHLSAFLTADAFDRIAPSIRAAYAGEHATIDVDMADGRVFTVEVAPFHGDDGELTAALTVWRDVNEQVRERRARERAEERFREAFDHAPIGMCLASLTGRFLRVNRALSEITGRTEADLLTHTLQAITHPDDLGDGLERRRELLEDERERYDLEQRFIHADGHAVWTHLNVTLVRDESDAPQHFIAQIQDITERKALERLTLELTRRDPLTDLLNRRGFEEELARELASARRYHRHGAVLMIDLDGFKAVNDTLGHQAGDELLCKIARAIRNRLRLTDIVGRLGGDEFAVVLPEITLDAAAQLAGGLCAIVRRHGLGIPADTEGVTASVGVARFDAVASAEAVLARADAAMYAAKHDGGDRTRVDGGTLG